MNEDMGDLLSDKGRSTFGSDQEALLALMEETGYNIVQENGQRTFGGPPPGWNGDPPPRGCEVFVGKIPRDMFEDELIPVFKRAGRIYEFRLMMEFSGENRGYAFVKYTVREAAQRAIQMLDNFQIRPGRFIGVCVSLENCRLFISCIPKDKRKEEIMEELKKVTDEVVDVIVYPSNIDKNKNRGFAFIEYGSHKAAAMARRKLTPGTYQLWGKSIQVNWARPEKDVDEETRQHIRVLYVRNLMMGTTEETIRREFSCFKPGSVERVKKLNHYAFVHYRCREDAITALQLMNGAVIDGVPVEVMLAKPSGSKDGSLAGRRRGARAYPGNNTGGGAGVMARRHDDRSFLLQRNDREMFGREDAMEGRPPLRPLSPPSRLGRRSYEGTQGVGDLEGWMFSLPPGTRIFPTSLHSVKPSHFSSAVGLLEFYCHKNSWSPPEYYLHFTPGQDGKQLFIYKVTIPSTRSSYMPDKLCTLLEDAKELAAQYTLWHLDTSYLSRGTSDSLGSLSTPLTRPTAATITGPGVLTYSDRAFASCFPPPSPFSPSPVSPLSLPLPSHAVPASQAQRQYMNLHFPFY